MQSLARRWARIGNLVLVIAAIAGGCSSQRRTPAASKNSGVRAPDRSRTILLIGTSLTAGYGLDPADAWPALVQQKIDSAHLTFHVVNAGVSGETSSDALQRLGWLMSQGVPSVVMIETGANDGLRGQSVDSLRANLDAILGTFDSMRPRPALIVAGMQALPNLGRTYGERFRGVYPVEAHLHHDYYLPFLLEGVAGVPSLNQADGLHPNPAGSRIVANTVWRLLKPILDSVATAAQP